MSTVSECGDVRKIIATLSVHNSCYIHVQNIHLTCYNQLETLDNSQFQNLEDTEKNIFTCTYDSK